MLRLFNYFIVLAHVLLMFPLVLIQAVIDIVCTPFGGDCSRRSPLILPISSMILSMLLNSIAILLNDTKMVDKLVDVGKYVASILDTLGGDSSLKDISYLLKYVKNTSKDFANEEYGDDDDIDM